MEQETGRIFYVDDRKGCDGNEGVSPETAWKTLDRVNTQIFRSGDRVRFRREASGRAFLSLRETAVLGRR